MAILTALLSALTRKLGTLIQALMGWSVAALFGRLTPPKRLMVSIALVISVLWPLFVVGVFFPRAAAVVIAFVPVDDLVGQRVFRVLWIALAVTSPLVVGLLVQAAAGHRSKGALRMVLAGYPLTLGFAISFVVTVLTVPALKIASVARRWRDEHVYVQPHPGQYQAALAQLCEACLRAGLTPEVRELPWSMALATQVIKRFARGGLDALIVDDPKLVKSEGLELYLYPGDLLLRGEEHALTRVRAVLGHTQLERFAWLVESEKAQHLQDELGRVWDALARHEVPDDAVPALRARLKDIAVESTKPGITYGDWVMLDRVTRRVEDKLEKKDSLTEARSSADAVRVKAQVNVGPALHGPPGEATPVELLKAALDESRELVKLEVALAKAEAEQQVREAVRAIIGFAVAAVFAIMALTLFAVAIVLAIGAEPADALAVGAVVLVLGALAAWYGYSKLPKKPLEHTREHVEDDVKQLKEHLA